MTQPNGTTRRRLVASGAGALGATMLGRGAMAAGYPDRRIDVIIQFPPGGGSDVFARIAAKGLETAVGQPAIPINRPGAGAMIGTNAAKNARSDGYTLLWVSISFLVNPIIRSVGYDPVTDFTAIGMIARAIYMLVCNPKRGFNTASDLIDYARAHPTSPASPAVAATRSWPGSPPSLPSHPPENTRSRANITKRSRVDRRDVGVGGKVEAASLTLSGLAIHALTVPVRAIAG